jgi:hypothetical protein
VSQGLEIFLWNPELQLVNKKRKTRKCEKEEGAQVTANMGMLARTTAGEE